MTAAEERRAEVGLPVPWKRNSTLVSFVFFGLTCVGLGALYAFWSVLRVEAGLFTGAIGLATAEYLIRRQRFFGTGIESALWIGSLFALITAIPGKGSKEAIFLFAAAALIAAFRLRQPYFGALGVFLAVSYFGLVRAPRTVLVLTLAVTLIALVLLAKQWRRPSVERFFVIVLIAMPVAPLIWNQYNFWGGVPVPAILFTAIYTVLTMTLLAAGVALRHHGPFLAAIVTGGIALFRYQDIKLFAIEWQLLALGAALLIVSAIVLRGLKGRTRGFVTTPAGFTMLDEELQMAATIALQPRIVVGDLQQPHEVTETRAGGGGEFGGAGSTGEY